MDIVIDLFSEIMDKVSQHGWAQVLLVLFIVIFTYWLIKKINTNSIIRNNKNLLNNKDINFEKKFEFDGKKEDNLSIESAGSIKSKGDFKIKTGGKSNTTIVSGKSHNNQEDNSL